MVTYPIRISGDPYRGTDPRRKQKTQALNRLAADLESKINEMIANQTAPIRTYLYHQIARETGFDYETVRDLCFSIDGGHNGFRVCKPGLTLEQALAEAEKEGSPQSNSHQGTQS